VFANFYTAAPNTANNAVFEVDGCDMQSAVTFDGRTYPIARQRLTINKQDIANALGGSFTDALKQTRIAAGTGQSFESWVRVNSATDAALGEIRVYDTGGTLRIGGVGTTPGYLAVTSVTALPTATISNRGCLAFVPGSGAGTADQLYVCLMSATGTYAWKQAFSGV